MLRSLATPLLAACLLLPACLEIDGGAVEVKWVIRQTDQSASKCEDADPDIDRIRVRIVGEGDPTETDLCADGTVPGCSFECKQGRGTTPFKIAPGEYFLSLEALDATGVPISTAEVALPPPIRRSIRDGDLTDLGVWQVVITVP